MTVLFAGSDPRELFSHLLLWGAGALCQDAGLNDVRLFWTAGQAPRPAIDADGLTDERLGELVRAHAAAHQADSWLQIGQPAEPTRGLFSPRVKPPADRGAWTALQAARQTALDELTAAARHLDLEMVAGLGEPASWPTRRNGEMRPDEAASRLEMQPRNQGSEVVGTRLRPLAAALSGRSATAVAAGLLGVQVKDDIGRDKPDSRGGANLRPLGPTDSAQTWVALWGLTQLPVAHQVRASSRTPLHTAPAGPASPAPRAGTFCVPVWREPWRPARLRSVARSAALSRVGSSHAGNQAPAAADVAWLRSRGVLAVWTFPVGTFGSSNAPERRALGGTLHRLTEV